MARVRIFRWKAIGPLLLLLALLGFFWVIFGDGIVESTSEEATSDLLGTEVDIRGLTLHETDARIDIAAVAVADPFDSRRNLIEASTLVLDLDPAALLEKKLVIDRLHVQDLSVGTRRSTPARPADPRGYAATLLRQVQQWSTQFKVPLLTLSPIDTIRQLVLDPTQLSTIREVERVRASADSLQQAVTRDLGSLGIGPTIDSARALADRLAGANPARLGVAGTRDAVRAIRATLSEVESTRDRIRQLERNGIEGIRLLRDGVAAVDQARQNDLAFARGLLQLPRFSAPDIGAALFGQVSIERFQQAVYWAELARRHLPPGLDPRARQGTRRLRMDGTTVEFPKSHDFPAFLLRQGDLNLSFDAFGGSHRLTAQVRGLTSQPAIYGKPATVLAQGSIGGSHPMRLDATALIDHVRASSFDSAAATLNGVPLPSFHVPGLPFRLDPGTGVSAMTFALRGDQVQARWSMRSSMASWQVDSTTHLGTVESLIWRVVSGLNDLDVTAEMTGPLRSPRFAVHSNVDAAIAERVRAVLGEEVAKAEEQVRAEVDRLVAAKIAEARAQVSGTTNDVTSRIGTAREQLEAAKADLEKRLTSLTRLGGVLDLPP
jgi:uncharacterized protein (TIGR03545 family)